MLTLSFEGSSSPSASSSAASGSTGVTFVSVGLDSTTGFEGSTTFGSTGLSGAFVDSTCGLLSTTFAGSASGDTFSLVTLTCLGALLTSFGLTVSAFFGFLRNTNKSSITSTANRPYTSN